MQVKVFEAPDMASGLKMVKDALGPDALILSTKSIRRGKLGVIGKPMLEITAAVDQPAVTEKKVFNPAQRMRQTRKSFAAANLQDEELNYQNIWDESNADLQLKQRPRTQSYTPPETPSVHEEINQLRSVIEGLNRKIEKIDTPAYSASPYVEPEFLQQPVQVEPDNQELLSRLMQCGINIQLAASISGLVYGQAEQSAKTEAQLLLDTVAGLLQVSSAFADEDSSQKRMALIGATGVGKTTTIAKIAAGYLSSFAKKAGLITIDTYRIAAVEQLKVYGEIMQVPVEVVIKPDQMEAAFERLSDCDLILIDTAGRSPRDQHELHELTHFLKPHYHIENHLVLDASKREDELLATINHFGANISVDNIIFSKIDECERLGVLLNLHSKKKLPLSFLTNGQRVPEDILTPDPQLVAGLILDRQRELHHD